jgi:hypothetical protein
MAHQGSSLIDELANLRSRVAALSETLWAAHDGDELMRVIEEVSSLASVLDALSLGVVRELEASGAVKQAGWASTQDFLTHTRGGHKGTGPALVRLAAATAEPGLAPVAEAMQAGWLSTAKAHVIERAVDRLPGDLELRARGVQVLLDDAKRLDASELKKVALHLVTVVDPEGDERRDERALDRLERAAHLGRHFAITDDQAGGAWIRGRCSSEDAAMIKATLIPLAGPAPRDGEGDLEPDVRDHGVRLLDALVEGCRRLQTADVLPESHGAGPRLTLTMDYGPLRDLTGMATTETGELLSASAVRRLCCDADVIPAVLGTESQVLDVGRQQRLATAAIWKALVLRDGHCRFPGCTRPPVMCHAHHLQHWVDGGPTTLANLILLCGHHHRLIHAGPWTIRVTAPGCFAFDPPPRVARSHGPPLAS